MPANPLIMVLGVAAGALAGVLLALSHSKPPGAQDKAAKDAQAGRAAMLFMGAMLLGFAAFVLGFLGWEGNAALSNEPIGNRQGALASLNSKGLFFVAGAYLLGYIGLRSGRALFSRRS